MANAIARQTTVFCMVVICSTCEAQPFRTVALTGMQAADGMGGTGTYGQFGTVTLNNDGRVAFLAQLVPDGSAPLAAVWSDAGNEGVVPLAIDSQPASGVAGAEFTDLAATQPFINDSGQVLFRGSLAVGVGGVTTSDNTGIWIVDPDEPATLVLREGDPVPGSAATFGSQAIAIERATARFNSAGQTTLHHRLPGVPSTQDFGIWVEAIGQSTQEVARAGNPDGGFPSGSAFYSFLASSTINDNGTIGFFGSATTFLPQQITEEVIWIGTPGDIQRALVEGDPAPGVDGATFVDLETPSLNNADGYAFAGFTDTDVTGVWASRTGGSLELLYRGDGQPFHLLGTAAIENFGTILLNSVGEVAFTSTTLDAPGAGPPGVDPSTNSALWSEGNSDGLREVAREGDQPVGTAEGVEFAAFAAPTINAQSQVAFMADLRGTVNATNNQAIFAEDTNGTLHLIARKGDVLDVDDGPGVDERTIALLGFWGGTGNEDGRRSAFNDVGELAFTAVFSDGTAGIFVSSLVASLGTPGDYNNDGTVDAADYTVWRDAHGSLAALPNDGGLGTPIRQEHYDLWATNFGSIAAAGSAQASSIPEPSAVALLLSALIATLHNRTTLVRSPNASPPQNMLGRRTLPPRNLRSR